MEKKSLKELVGAALASAALVASVGLVGCGGSNNTTTNTTADTSTEEEVVDEETVDDEEEEDTGAAAPGEAAGFTEIPIFEDEEVEFMNVSAVYFQPVPMAPGQENIEDYDLHLECDISALKNDLGYGVGDWIPYLTVDYEVIGSDGTTAAEGTFMEMSASDGPHYGANIALPDADTYDLVFTFHSPAENGYLIHSDAETGPGGVLEDYFADGNLTLEYKGWDYVPQEW